MDDNYIFCIKCKEFVLEFCSLHGPPLIIPDSKLAFNLSPPRISHAALTIPHDFLHLAPSNINESHLGVFTSKTLPIGIRFGPYRGVYSNTASSMRCWLIYNKNKSYIIDGGDPNKSNWMRYVNCSRHFNEQNLIAYQQNGHIYYSTIKLISPKTELLVFYGSEFAHLLNIDLRKYNKPEKIHDTTKTITFYKTTAIHVNKLFPDQKHQQTNIQNTYTSNTNQNYTEILNNVQKPDLSNKFPCDVCERKFNLKYSLTRHKRLHLSIKRFKCQYCDYGSNERYVLITHINASHTKEVTYTCNICSKVFYVAKNYKRHQKLHLKHKS